MNIDERDIKKYKSILFILGGIFAGYLGISFSRSGFGFEVPGYEWAGWGLGILCVIVQVAFSSQLAYKSYNYVIFILGILAYIYSGWSNYIGIMSINPKMNHYFALLIGEFLDWSAEPLIIYGLIGVSENGEGDFLRNLFGLRPKKMPTPNIPSNKKPDNHKNAVPQRPLQSPTRPLGSPVSRENSKQQYNQGQRQNNAPSGVFETSRQNPVKNQNSSSYNGYGGNQNRFDFSQQNRNNISRIMDDD